MRSSRFAALFLAAAVALFAMPALAQGKGKGNDKADEAKGKVQKKDKADKDKPGKEKADKGKHGKDKADKHDHAGHDHDGHGHGHKEKPEKADKGEKKGDDEPTTQPADGEAKKHAGKHLAHENEKHLKRLAKIQRLAEIGAEKKNDKLVEKAKMLRDKENARHARAVERIEAGNLGKHEGEEKKEEAAEKKEKP